MHKLQIIPALCLLLLYSCHSAAQEKAYPLGLTIDSNIKQKIPARKEGFMGLGNGDGSFKISQFVNGSKATGSFFSGDNMPLTAMFEVDKKAGDTVLIFINMLIPYGIQLRLKDAVWKAETFVSSRSCKCFKSKLTDQLSYGAGAVPDSLTLVLNKGTALQKGETLYGYLKATGGKMYHFNGEKDSDSHETYSFNYEGYFAVKFDPMGE